MLLTVEFDASADIIDVPAFIIMNVEHYRENFLKWLSDTSNKHAYWWYYENGKIRGLNYRSDALVEWLNAFPLADSNEKAKIISSHVSEYDDTIPSIFF